MRTTLREHAEQIIQEAIHAVQPDAAVRRALEGRAFSGRVLLVAAGKAAWQIIDIRIARRTRWATESSAASW